MAEIAQQLKPLDAAALNPPMNIVLVEDGSGLEKLAKFVQRIAAEAVPVLGIDTETNVVPDFWHRRVRSVQVGDKNEQFVIDLLALAGSEDKLIESQGLYGRNNAGLFAPVFDILDPVLTTNKFLKVGQNLAFEYEVFNWNFGRRIWHLYSTDLAERVIQAGRISLKKYSEFSMVSLAARHLKVLVDKTEQGNFDLKSPLTEKQILYAALDTRLPLAIRQAQLRVLTTDQLLTTAQIENDALGSYTDMHLTGQRIDQKRWMKRVVATKARRVEEIKILDEYFIPVVGKKSEAIDYPELVRLENVWKSDFEKATPAEMAKAKEARLEPDKDRRAVLRLELKALEGTRKKLKADARKAYSEKSKQRTKYLKIIEKCEGEAFINYGSNTQLPEALKKFPGMSKITGVGDDVLLKFNDRPMIQTLRRYRKGKKDTGTYGEQWTQIWVNKPCKEQGWLHPGDGRLHCLFNQLEAETGRSSSSKPNAQNLPKEDEVRACFIADPPDAEEPDGYVIVTVDMSGAELRIIAELAQAKSWITAFAKGQDVHSVSTEILYPEKWPLLACKGGEKWYDPEKKEEVTLPPCAYYALNKAGEPARAKCKCPEHVELRNGTKATNFLLCYGGGPSALADALDTSLDKATDIYKLHESRFPDVWGYLNRSGERAKKYKESRDMYGRRRLFPEPTYDTAREWFIEYEEEKLELNDEEKEAAIFRFKSVEMREPNKEETWSLTHRAPNDNDIRQAMRAMAGSIGRRGKNHAIQGTNASIAKRAMGCGFDKDGKPYLWHTLLQYKARIQNMVHDELVLQCPKRFGQVVADLVGDAFRRAAAEVMTEVIMEHDAHIAERWLK